MLSRPGPPPKLSHQTWVVQANGTATLNAGGIANDGGGGALVTGYFSDGDASFGSTSFTSQGPSWSPDPSGPSDAFVMHVTAMGAIDWAVQVSSPSMTQARGIANDGGGCALVTGYFYGEASFGSKALTSRGSADAFVMHVTASGVIDWAVQVGGPGADRGFGIVHDGAGGALMTGDFSGKASFGSTSLTSRGSVDAFVMHVTASGVIDWAVQVGGTGADRGFGIAHDGDCGSLVTGVFNGNASFGSTNLTSRSIANTFVMHVMKAGAIDWAVQVSSPSMTQARGIANDGGGGALVTGYFYGEASFGSTSLTSRDTSADVFVMHVTAAGAIDWVVQAGGTADTRGSGVAYDGRSGGALVTGDFSGEASFGSTSLTSRGSSDAFVMHVTAAGAIDWAIQAGGKLRDSGYGIALVDGRDGVDGFLVSGTFSGEASFGSNTLNKSGDAGACFAARLMPPPPSPPSRPPVVPLAFIESPPGSPPSLNPYPAWAVQAGGTATLNVGGIANDGGGGALVTGYLSHGDASFGSTSLTSRGSANTFVMHVTAAGAIDWAVQVSSPSMTQARGIANDGGGCALVTGYFYGEASFGSKALTSRGSADAFVMHVTASGVIDWAVQVGGTGADRGFGIAHDGAGGALMVGDFQSEASFGSMSLTSRGSVDAFVMHVTAAGAIDWVVQVGGRGVAADARGIANDGGGGALVTGYFNGKATFGSTVLTSRGGVDAFVMHVTASGTIDWAVQVGGPSRTQAHGIANDGGGGALVAGYFYGSTVLTTGDTSADAFVMHVTAAGAIDWVVQAGGPADTRGFGVAYDGGSGGALVTGDFSGEASFGSTSLTSRGSSDAFVMHVTAAGAIDWAIQAGGKLRDSGYGIALVDGRDGVDGFLVSGTFSGEASFGSNTLNKSGDAGACFAARLMPPPPSPPSRPSHSPRVPPGPLGPPGLPPVSPLIPFLTTAFLTSFLLLLCVCRRYRRLVDNLIVSRERAQLDLRMLEHRVNAVELQTDPQGGGLLPVSPPNSIPPGPPSSRGIKSSGAGSGAGSSSASSSHAAPEPQHADPSPVPAPNLEVTVPTSAHQMTVQSQQLLSTAGSSGSLAAPPRAPPPALPPPPGDSATAADGAASDAEKESARKARARIYTEFIAAVLKSPSKKAKTGGGGVAMSSAAGSAGSSSDPVSAVAAAGAAAAATDGMAAGGAAADGAEALPMPRSFLYLNHDQIPPGSVPGDEINVFHVNGGPGMWITIPPHWIPGHGLRFQSTEPAPEEKDGKGSMWQHMFPRRR